MSAKKWKKKESPSSSEIRSGSGLWPAQISQPIQCESAESAATLVDFLWRDQSSESVTIDNLALQASS